MRMKIETANTPLTAEQAPLRLGATTLYTAGTSIIGFARRSMDTLTSAEKCKLLEPYVIEGLHGSKFRYENVGNH